MAGLDREMLEMTLDAIGDFAARELPEKLLIDLDERDEFPAELVKRMCSDDLGVQLLFIPEEYGGMGGSAFDVYRTCERMAAIDLGVATSVLATFLGSDPIVVGGTPEQQARWLGRIAAEGLLMAYGATEPEAGSDLGALKTVAVPVLDDAGAVTAYRITGKKQWISNGGVADLYTILANAPGRPELVRRRPRHARLRARQAGEQARHPPQQHRRPVPRRGRGARRPSRRRRRGPRSRPGPARVRLHPPDGRRLRPRCRLGRPRPGDPLLGRANPGRQRRSSEKQGYTHKLIVPHAVRLEAARAYIEETAERLDEVHIGLNTEGAIAKYLATEAGNAAADAAIQALGGYGYTHEYLVEKIKRDVRITTIYEGTSEIMEMTIARDRWQQHLKTGGRYYHDAGHGTRGAPPQPPVDRCRCRRPGPPRPGRGVRVGPDRPPDPQPARAVPPRRAGGADRRCRRPGPAGGEGRRRHAGREGSQPVQPRRHWRRWPVSTPGRRH